MPENEIEVDMVDSKAVNINRRAPPAVNEKAPKELVAEMKT